MSEWAVTPRFQGRSETRAGQSWLFSRKSAPPNGPVVNRQKRCEDMTEQNGTRGLPNRERKETSAFALTARQNQDGDLSVIEGLMQASAYRLGLKPFLLRNDDGEVIVVNGKTVFDLRTAARTLRGYGITMQTLRRGLAGMISFETDELRPKRRKSEQEITDLLLREVVGFYERNRLAAVKGWETLTFPGIKAKDIKLALMPPISGAPPIADAAPNGGENEEIGDEDLLADLLAGKEDEETTDETADETAEETADEENKIREPAPAETSGDEDDEDDDDEPVDDLFSARVVKTQSIMQALTRLERDGVVEKRRAPKGSDAPKGTHYMLKLALVPALIKQSWSKGDIEDHGKAIAAIIRLSGRHGGYRAGAGRPPGK